ncbi:MAG: hypothetical protein ACLGIR_03375 [Actinomycetes bacterium]
MRRPAVTLLALSVLVPGTAALVPAPAGVDAAPPAPVQEALGCDPLDPGLCLFPFPNDAFTRADAATETGRRIAFSAAAMPRNGADPLVDETNGAGKPTDPTEWNRNDGFSPGQAVLTLVPGLDLHRTWGTQDEAVASVGLNELGWFDHRDHIADIERYLDEDAPIVVLNTRTGERHPFWSELDTHPGVTDGRRSLILRPAVNWTAGDRYIVALRDLRRADGSVIDAGPYFRSVLDGSATGSRAARLREIVTELKELGIGTNRLHSAWDFTVASTASTTGRMLAIRDDAFTRILGDTDLTDRRVEGRAPAFRVVSTADRDDVWTDGAGRERVQRVRRVEGVLTVPNYLDRPQNTESLAQPNPQFDPPAPGSRFFYGTAGPLGDALPRQNPALPEVQVPFRCDVPLGEGPTAGVLYGHGLLGTRSQVGDVKFPRRYGFAGCAMDFWGMASGDLPTVAAILADISNMPSLVDRSQQGFLNFLLLGRAMVHPDGLVTHPAFQQDGEPLLVTDTGQGTELYYDGNSQGGILGGPIVATSPDVLRGVLGVTGMNYSTLLNRSVDWEGSYGEVYYATYQDPAERQLGMQLIQMLWDRGESNGYAANTGADPLPNTPRHEVLLQIAWSDHQVTVHAAEVNAATVGAPVMDGLPEGVHWAKRRFLAPTPFPHRGSALVYWDSGNATPPNGNLPATHSRDPHGDPRNEPAASWQEAHWLRTGWVVDVCDGGPQLTRRHPANGGTPSCVEPDERP